MSTVHPDQIAAAIEQDNLGRDIEHAIEIDPDITGTSFAAFCTYRCNWRGDWHHAEDFDNSDGQAAALAHDEALAEGQDHLDGVGL